MYAAIYPDLSGQPWEHHHDVHLRQDFDWGCTVFTMSKRARRPEHEVEARLAELGLSLDAQPKGRRIRNTTWTRR